MNKPVLLLLLFFLVCPVFSQTWSDYEKITSLSVMNQSYQYAYNNWYSFSPDVFYYGYAESDQYYPDKKTKRLNSSTLNVTDTDFTHTFRDPGSEIYKQHVFIGDGSHGYIGQLLGYGGAYYPSYVAGVFKRDLTNHDWDWIGSLSKYGEYSWKGIDACKHGADSIVYVFSTKKDDNSKYYIHYEVESSTATSVSNDDNSSLHGYPSDQTVGPRVTSDGTNVYVLYYNRSAADLILKATSNIHAASPTWNSHIVVNNDWDQEAAYDIVAQDGKATIYYLNQDDGQWLMRVKYYTFSTNTLSSAYTMYSNVDYPADEMDAPMFSEVINDKTYIVMDTKTGTDGSVIISFEPDDASAHSNRTITDLKRNNQEVYSTSSFILGDDVWCIAEMDSIYLKKYGECEEPTISVSTVNYYQIQLSITRGAEDARQYKIYRKRSGQSYALEATINSTGETTSWIDYDLNASMQVYTYYYKVKATDYSGFTSDYSNEVNIDAMPNMELNDNLVENSVTLSKYDLSVYPNPFNPSTNLKVSLPEEGLLTLKIYDTLGKKVFEVNEYKESGWHNYRFNAANLSNGLYIYEFSINNFIKCGKLLLVK